MKQRIRYDYRRAINEFFMCLLDNKSCFCQAQAAATIKNAKQDIDAFFPWYLILLYTHFVKFLHFKTTKPYLHVLRLFATIYQLIQIYR